MNPSPELIQILHMHINQMYKGACLISWGQETLELKNIEESTLINIANQCKDIFSKEPILLNISCHDPIIVVGDLHGHILDLYRILVQFGLPPHANYLFLGDLVDRGPCSIETVTLLFVLKILYPKNIFIIRGNHEFEKFNVFGGFFEDISSTYSNTQVFDSFISAFDYLPLAAQIGTVFCVHAGIGPGLSKLSQISSLERPIHTTEDSIVCSLVWSDPSDDVKEFSISPRGSGFCFGSIPLLRFLKNNQLSCLVRGHECVSGTRNRFKNKCISIFSASNYCGTCSNNSGILRIVNNIATPFSLEPLKYIPKQSINFFWAEETPHFQSINEQILKQVISNSSFSLMPFLIGNLPQTIENNGMQRRVKMKANFIKKSRSLEHRSLQLSISMQKSSIQSKSIMDGLQDNHVISSHQSLPKLLKIEEPFVPSLQDLVD